MFPKKKRTVPRMVWNAVTRSTHLLMSGVSDNQERKKKRGTDHFFSTGGGVEGFRLGGSLDMYRGCSSWNQFRSGTGTGSGSGGEKRREGSRW